MALSDFFGADAPPILNPEDYGTDRATQFLTRFGATPANRGSLMDLYNKYSGNGEQIGTLDRAITGVPQRQQIGDLDRQIAGQE